MPHSGRHFLVFWRILVPKSSISVPPWRPAGPQKASRIAQVAPKCLTILSPGLTLRVTYFQGPFLERSWAPFWLILGPPGFKIVDFRMIFFTFSFWGIYLP